MELKIISESVEFTLFSTKSEDMTLEINVKDIYNEDANALDISIQLSPKELENLKDVLKVV